MAGPAGVGKTQLCLHLCCTAQLPSTSSSSSFGQVAFLDTEGAFNAHRMKEVAEETKEEAAKQAEADGNSRSGKYCPLFWSSGNPMRAHLVLFGG